MAEGSFLAAVDFSRQSFWYAAVIALLAPTIWNTLARLEYYTHFLTKVTVLPPSINETECLNIQDYGVTLQRLLYSRRVDL